MAPREVFLRGPKDPRWSCNCGHDGNYGCRVHCRKCGREQPEGLLRKAKERQAEHDKKAAEREKREKAAERAKRERPARTYADAAKSDKAQADFQAKLLKSQEELAKSVAALADLQKPKAVAQLGGGQLAGAAMQVEVPDVDDRKVQQEERQKLKQELDTIKELGIPDDTPVVVEKRARYQYLAQQRPVATQVQECERKKARLQERHDKKAATITALKEEIAEKQAQCTTLEKEVVQLAKEIDDCEKERVKVLADSGGVKAKEADFADLLGKLVVPEELKGALQAVRAYVNTQVPAQPPPAPVQAVSPPLGGTAATGVPVGGSSNASPEGDANAAAAATSAAAEETAKQTLQQKQLAEQQQQQALAAQQQAAAAAAAGAQALQLALPPPDRRDLVELQENDVAAFLDAMGLQHTPDMLLQGREHLAKAISKKRKCG